MTMDDLNQWIIAAEQNGISIVLGPRLPDRPEPITITRDNILSLVQAGHIKLES